MVFPQRLKEKRLEANLTQSQLAANTGISLRTIQNYENGCRFPRRTDAVTKLAAALDTTEEYLMGAYGQMLLDARDKGGVQAVRDLDALVGEVTGLFAGGSFNDDALDGAMQAITQAYWIAKEKNKKYAPKKHAKGNVE